jgi:hypothetical protein
MVLFGISCLCGLATEPILMLGLGSEAGAFVALGFVPPDGVGVNFGLTPQFFSSFIFDVEVPGAVPSLSTEKDLQSGTKIC